MVIIVIIKTIILLTITLIIIIETFIMIIIIVAEKGNLRGILRSNQIMANNLILILDESLHNRCEKFITTIKKMGMPFNRHVGISQWIIKDNRTRKSSEVAPQLPGGHGSMAEINPQPSAKMCINGRM